MVLEILVEPRILGRSLRSHQTAAPLPSPVPRHRRGECKLAWWPRNTPNQGKPCQNAWFPRCSSRSGPAEHAAVGQHPNQIPIFRSRKKYCAKNRF